MKSGIAAGPAAYICASASGPYARVLSSAAGTSRHARRPPPWSSRSDRGVSNSLSGELVADTLSSGSGGQHRLLQHRKGRREISWQAALHWQARHLSPGSCDGRSKIATHRARVSGGAPMSVLSSTGRCQYRPMRRPVERHSASIRIPADRASVAEGRVSPGEGRRTTRGRADPGPTAKLAEFAHGDVGGGGDRAGAGVLIRGPQIPVPQPARTAPGRGALSSTVFPATSPVRISDRSGRPLATRYWDHVGPAARPDPANSGDAGRRRAHGDYGSGPRSGRMPDLQFQQNPAYEGNRITQPVPLRRLPA